MLASIVALVSRVPAWGRRIAAFVVFVAFGIALLAQGTWQPTNPVSVGNREDTSLQVYVSPEIAHYGDSITVGAWVVCGQEQPTGSLTFYDGDQVLTRQAVTDTY